MGTVPPEKGALVKGTFTRFNASLGTVPVIWYSCPPVTKRKGLREKRSDEPDDSEINSANDDAYQQPDSLEPAEHSASDGSSVKSIYPSLPTIEERCFAHNGSLPGQKNPRPSNTLCYLIIFIIGIFSLVTGTSVIDFYEIINGPKKDITTLLTKSIEDLKEDFREQSDDLWVKMFIAAEDVSANPEKPSVLILVAKRDNEELLQCLARRAAARIHHDYSEANEYLTLRGETFKNRSKGEMNDIIRTTLGHTTRIALVENVEELTSDQIMLFHGLCDDQNAPIKDAIYLFTQTTDNLGHISKYEVTRPWNDLLKVDTKLSLESRLQPVAFINEGGLPSKCRKIVL